MREYRITSKRRIPEGSTCSCGCGSIMPTRYLNGKPLYMRGESGPFLHGHNMRDKKANNHPHWKGGRYKHRYYWYLYAPEHPMANALGYVFEHRLIWEQVHGRLLQPNEHVHHINGDSLDNRPENLIALTISAHRKLHGGPHPTHEQRQIAQRASVAARIVKKAQSL